MDQGLQKNNNLISRLGIITGVAMGPTTIYTKRVFSVFQDQTTKEPFLYGKKTRFHCKKKREPAVQVVTN